MQQRKIIFSKEQKKTIRSFLKIASDKVNDTNFKDIVHLKICVPGGERIFLPKFPEYKNLLKKCINLIVKHIDLKNSITENEVKNLLKNKIFEQYSKKSDQTDNLIEELSNIVKVNFTFILPNHILIFNKGTESIRFGNTVECIPTETIINEYANSIKNLDIIVNKECHQSYNLKQITLNSDHCFRINIKKCSVQMVDSVARWHVDVVMSLIKLRNYLFPKISIIKAISINEIPSYVEKEAHTYSTPYEEIGLLVFNNSIVKPGGHVRTRYIINSNTQKELDKTNFAEICDKICNANRDEFYDSIQKALGWMTKARTSNDTATKFLFFFTALEALIEIANNYREEKTNNNIQHSNITKTIAIIVSTIFADPENRELVKKEITKLYKIRCLLVHSGCRDILVNDCEELQYYTERVCGWFLFIVRDNHRYHDIGTRIFDAHINKTKIKLESS